MLRALTRCFLVKAGFIPRPDLIARVQPDHPSPDDLVVGRLVVVRDGPVEKWICLRCPCGCGEKILLNLSANKSPRWRVSVDWLRRPTAEPSVLQVRGCRSHFWIKGGRIDWCADSGHKTAKGRLGDGVLG